MNTIIEILKFLINNKKYYLIPIFVFLIMFAVLLMVSSGSSLAPFIYTIF